MRGRDRRLHRRRAAARSVDELLGFWKLFTPASCAQQLVFLILFIGLTIGGWFLVRAFWQRTRLPVAKQLDEIGGAVLGLALRGLSIVTYARGDGHLLPVRARCRRARAGPIEGFYEAMDASVLVDFFRATLIPTARLMLRARSCQPTSPTSWRPMIGGRGRTDRPAAGPLIADRAWFDRSAAEVAPDLLGAVLIHDTPAGADRRPHRRGRGLPRARGPGRALLARRDPAQRGHVRRSPATSTSTWSTGCTTAPTWSAARAQSPRPCCCAPPSSTRATSWPARTRRGAAPAAGRRTGQPGLRLRHRSPAERRRPAGRAGPPAHRPAPGAASIAAARIGVDYAGDWAERPLRYLDPR